MVLKRIAEASRLFGERALETILSTQPVRYAYAAARIVSDAEFSYFYERHVREAGDFIAQEIAEVFHNEKPTIALTLGSGLNKLAQEAGIIMVKKRIPYSEIPSFPSPTVHGHAGNLVLGTVHDVPIVGLEGRTHAYEGLDRVAMAGLRASVFPVHALAEAGVKQYFFTNAAGGLNTTYSAGDLMIVKDHVGLFFPNPLVGRHLDLTTLAGEPLARFQPLSEAYDPTLVRLFGQAAAEKHATHVHLGILGALSGTNYETAAEVRALRTLGVDAIGMSSVPETLAAKNRGMNVLGVTFISNVTAPDGTNATSHAEVVAALNSPAVLERLHDVFGNFFQLYSNLPK